MSTVFIHAGMPKTGSTSVQEWLRRNAGELRERHDLTLIVDHGPFDDTPGLVAHSGEPFVVANRFLLSYYGGIETGVEPAVLDGLCDRLAAELRAAADEHGDVILTAEGFGRSVFENEARVLAALQSLSVHHTVRVLAYVRPQHDALLSRWRQWGYLNKATPSDWFAGQIPQLRYHERILGARRDAPDVAFDLRPFRRDLLAAGDVVVDMAEYLGRGADLARPEAINENPGLDLDLTILLQGAPPATIRTPEHRRVHGSGGGARQVTLAEVTKEWDLPTSPQAAAATAAIHSIAHQEFATDNEALVEAQGWQTDTFVPVPDGPAATIGDLDRLFTPDLDPAMLARFHRAVADLCAHHESDSRP